MQLHEQFKLEFIKNTIKNSIKVEGKEDFKDIGLEKFGLSQLFEKLALMAHDLYMENAYLDNLILMSQGKSPISFPDNKQEVISYFYGKFNQFSFRGEDEFHFLLTKDQLSNLLKNIEDIFSDLYSVNINFKASYKEIMLRGLI